MRASWVRLSRGYRGQLLRRQNVMAVHAEGWEPVVELVRGGQGVMIMPNHSAHYDSTALYVAADQMRLPLFFMTAWQVFGMSSWWEQRLMQRIGCFSVDRESNDRQAFKQAVEILQSGPCPLVVFPEGDIYHTNDFVTPFREGAAAMALSAAKRGSRPVSLVPCGIKFWYEDDPSPGLQAALRRMELRLHLRPRPELPTAVRIHRLAEAALALKELDYTDHTCQGSVRQRITQLTSLVLQSVEARHGAKAGQRGTPERVKLLRQTVIQKLEQAPLSEREPLEQDMSDLFFAMQLYSYRGDYLDQEPSIERVAETVDKLEEDILDQPLPTVRGRRRVRIRLGEPCAVEAGERRREAVAELTHHMQCQVQQLIDELNRDGPR